MQYGVSFQLGEFQPGDIVTGRISALEPKFILVDFNNGSLTRVPIIELSLNELQTPEDAVQLNEIREFLVVGNYEGKCDIFFSHCSPEELMNSNRLDKAVCYQASLKSGRVVERENIILHAEILGVEAGGVSARLKWFLRFEEHLPTVYFSMRQLELHLAWERVRQLYAEGAIVSAIVLRKYHRSATVKIEGLDVSIHTYVEKHRQQLVEGEELSLKIIEVREQYNRLVLVDYSVWLRLIQLQIGQVAV